MLQKFLALPSKLKVELIFYPVFLLYRMPAAWAKSLWEARILLNGKWGRFMGFNPQNAINNLFYRTQWINLDRYGRDGRSPITGLGDYPLKNWFHLSLPASYIFANAGAVTTLTGTLVWVISHFLWLEHAGVVWLLFIIIVLLLSTTAYAMAFARQNYQILGWMWYPAALFFTSTGNYVLASFTWFAAGISGITPTFFAIPIVISLSIVSNDFTMLLVLLPAVLHTVLRFTPLIFDGGLENALVSIAKAIGVTQKKVRYNREMNHFSLVTLYLTGLYFFSTIVMSIGIEQVAVLPLLGTALFLINQRFFRVADEQSVILVAVSLFVFTAIQSEPNWLVLLSLWMAGNPFGGFLSIQRLNRLGDGDGAIIVNAPFDVTELVAGVHKFLSVVSPAERVYFAFDDPGGRYSNIFDGYRVIHELPLMVASNREIHLFPDWWAVAETNYEGAPQCWGRSLEEVVRNCETWNANYAIIYQVSDSVLEEKWNEDFELVSAFDWNSYKGLLRKTHLWASDRPTPKWFLLRYKKSSDLQRRKAENEELNYQNSP